MRSSTKAASERRAASDGAMGTSMPSSGSTSRGAVVDTRAVIGGLKSGHIGYLGLDVYEEEGDLFFRDLSDQVILDDVFARLTTFPNVLITGHQAFFTREALTAIASVTLQNLTDLERIGVCSNTVSAASHHR